jgi:hypothetical protein
MRGSGAGSHLGLHVENIRASLAGLAQQGVNVDEPRVSRTNSTIANATSLEDSD